jgi:heavy metal translocating P-type ATPase
VIACPCALGLATPLAILIGTTAGSAKGILMKGGDVVERLQQIDTAVLDKTGTLTEGRPSLGAFRGGGLTDQEALRIAASLERHSEHSIGRAIAEAGETLSLIPVDQFRAIPGRGIEGMVQGWKACVGSREFLRSQGVSPDGNGDVDLMASAQTEEASGATVVYLALKEKFAGFFSVTDKIRKQAQEAVAALKRLGIEVVMVTGDHPVTAEAVARAVGIEKVLAGVLPVGKADEIKSLQEQGKRVCMVGDGINDAPALVTADVGIAMGRATDIALDSADMVLMRDDLTLLPHAIRLSRKTLSVIRQNLFWAFLYNVVAIPLATAGILHPIVAASAMVVSSLTVVGNSLRLRKV